MQLSIIFKVERFLTESDIGFLMIFSRLCECQQKPCLRGSCGWVQTENPTQTSTSCWCPKWPWFDIRVKFRRRNQQQKERENEPTRDNGVTSLLDHWWCSIKLLSYHIFSTFTLNWTSKCISASRRQSCFFDGTYNMLYYGTYVLTVLGFFKTALTDTFC